MSNDQSEYQNPKQSSKLKVAGVVIIGVAIVIIIILKSFQSWQAYEANQLHKNLMSDQKILGLKLDSSSLTERSNFFSPTKQGGPKLTNIFFFPKEKKFEDVCQELFRYARKTNWHPAKIEKNYTKGLSCSFSDNNEINDLSLKVLVYDKDRIHIEIEKR